jgi:hypothetical protein
MLRSPSRHFNRDEFILEAIAVGSPSSSRDRHRWCPLVWRERHVMGCVSDVSRRSQAA